MLQSARQLGCSRRQELHSATTALLECALSSAADRRLDRRTRGHAARLADHIWHDVEHSERVLATGIGAVADAIDDAWIAGRLAKVVVRGRSRDHRLRASLFRVAARAHREGWHDSVATVLAAAASLDGVAAEVPAAWLEAVAANCGGSECFVLRLLNAWVPRLGAGHAGIRAIVGERSYMLRDLSTATVREIHCAEPTVEGWEVLARRERARARRPISMSFGDLHRQAIEKLEAALANAREPQSVDVLRRWHAELEG